MNTYPNLSPQLLRMNYYISPRGGAKTPYTIRKGRMVMEWLTAGPVVHPATGDLAQAGTIFLHRAGETTIHQAPEGIHYECMVLEYELAPDTPVPDWPRSLFWAEEEGGLAFAREMMHSLHQRRISKQVLGPFIWTQLVYQAEKTREQTRPIPRRISASLREMENHFDKGFSIEAISDKVGMSASHFHARFREVMGITPYQYLVQQRMRAARHRLVTTLEPIKAIAYNVGYANTENFCRAFKKESGMTAVQFRKANQTFLFD